MLSFLIDVTTGYLLWLILFILIWGILKLIKKEKLKTINFKTVFIVSLLGAFGPVVNLLNGNYQIITVKEVHLEISDSDNLALKTIIQSCLSGQKIDKETHKLFYTIVDKYKFGQKDINEFFSLFYREDLVHLQKSFYADALKTIQNEQISESKIRLELEERLLNKAQKERNREILKKVLAKEGIEIKGELIVLDEDIVKLIIDNIDKAFRISKQNVTLLKSRNSY